VPANHRTERQRQAQILIVDDDPSFRSSARILLAVRGYQVVGEADCGDEGLALASATCPDAVLLDVNLPDGDGLALAARLTAAGGPRVLLTSSDPNAAPDHLMRSSGAVGFVAKEELAEAPLDTYFTG
jgi:two-component system nitrate/nitrite response regulator NarL